MKYRLIVFTRYPKPGSTKTRLIGALGEQGAARLHQTLTQHVLARAELVASGRAVDVEVRFAGGSCRLMARCFGKRFDYRPQVPGHLGHRLNEAVTAAFCEGAERVVVIGTDCPAVTPSVLREAFDHLAVHDVVLGPAHDGGYYLIGLKRPQRELFSNIPWGGGEVLRATLRQAARSSLNVWLLPAMGDIDRPDDLPAWCEIARREGGAAGPGITVIVPVLNEAAHLHRSLVSACASPVTEVIVADGGSTDSSCTLATRYGCQIVATGRGRARQMNAAAREAQNDILLFLHADTMLPPQFHAAVWKLMENRRVAVGAFRLRIDGRGPALRVIEWGVAARSILARMPYGDQALFIRRETFEAAGGFPDHPILEDMLLVSRLQRRGMVRVLPQAVLTSARRWQRLGPWRTTFLNQRIVLGYWLGIPTDRLAAWYGNNTTR